MSDVDFTRMDDWPHFADSLAFLVTAASGSRDERTAEISMTFKRVMYHKLQYVPISDVVAWLRHVANLSRYLERRLVDDPRYVQLGGDLMHGLLSPLAKGLERNPWSRIVSLYTYQEFQRPLRQVVWTSGAANLSELQRRWDAGFKEFHGLRGALSTGTNLPGALADALSSFHQAEANKRTPAALAFFLVMVNLSNNERYSGHLATKPGLPLYLEISRGRAGVPATDLASQYVEALHNREAPPIRELPPEPDPARRAELSWVAVAVPVFFGAAVLFATIVAALGVALYYYVTLKVR